MNESPTVPASPDVPTPLLKLIRQRRRFVQAGLGLEAFLRVGGYAVTGLTAFALLDFLLAFPTGALWALDGLLVAGLAGAWLWQVGRAMAFSDRDMAGHSDQLAANRRRPVLTAYELQMTRATGPSGLEGFFIQKSIDDGCACLRKLPPGPCFPWSRIRRQSRILALQCAAAIVLLGAGFSANRVILARILLPWRDIPPWSPLVFTVTPSHPQALYGGTVELAVEITGGPIRAPVCLLTRKGGHVDRSACFQEGPGRFTQRMEKLVEPLEFCFAVGRARSRWRGVELRMQPRISLARIVITPPAYMQLPQRELVVGREEIAGPIGSRAVLSITSNRPLAEGTLTIHNRRETTEVVKSAKAAVHTLAFSWTMQDAARLELDFRDIRGTPGAEKLVINQKIIPDRPPAISLSEPAGDFALATPRSVVPVSGAVTDDIGLKEVELARTVVGYRDRMKFLGPPAPEKSFAFNEPLDLQSLGAEQGQVIELYVEARDTNPAFTGIGSSDIVRIEVISEDEYAAHLRDRITLEEFQARYQVVSAQLQAFLDAVKAARAEPSRAPRDDGRLAEQLKRAARLAAETEALFRKLGADFVVFDMEQQLGALVKESAARLKTASEDLARMRPDDAELGTKMDALLKAFGETAESIAKEAADAAEVVAAGNVMRQATVFKQLLKRQKDVVRKLQRYESAVKPDPAGLAALAAHETEIRGEVLEFARALAEAAGALPSTAEWDSLRQSALGFAGAIEKLGIPGFMQEAVTAGQNQDGPRTYQRAALALEKMQSLLEGEDCENSDFATLCQGRMRFRVRDHLAKTLRQMLSALFSRSGSATRGGEGSGGGGRGDDGYSVNEYSPLNVPVFGPDRMRFGEKAAAGAGSGPPGNGRVTIEPGSQERLNVPDKKAPEGESLAPERIPEKYREAVKKYFSQSGAE